ncbi:MAG: tetraacyldisaccharide 4'-kinase [Pseudomonadales bacterium]|nr:tetraacyldisaccharide 4'-kinase [Pseudomonadales bacterium]
MRKRLEQWVTGLWYRRPANGLVVRYLPLYLLSLLYSAIVRTRRQLYLAGIKRSWHPTGTVIVVGNITAGGTGKTPLTIAILTYLQSKGYRCGVVSRGYGGSSHDSPLTVDSSIDVEMCGDEPKMIAERLQIPVVVDRDRVRGANYLQSQFELDVIVCDDGLQHYRLQRDMEIVVFDGQRMIGNGHSIPLGPLRESARRLKHTDIVVVNGPEAENGGVLDNCSLLDRYRVNSHPPWFAMGLKPANLIEVGGTEVVDVNSLDGRQVVAIAGIGNPGRFFETLRTLGFNVVEKTYPDHYRYRTADFADFHDQIVVMTEKDAIKCRGLGLRNAWYLPVEAELPGDFFREIDRIMARNQ